MSLAKSLGLERHDEIPGGYDKQGKWGSIELTVNKVNPKEFANYMGKNPYKETYEKGILQMYNDNLQKTHYVYWSKASGIVDSLDPSRKNAGGYKVVKFKPLKSYKNW